MNFELSEKQQKIKERAAEFADREVAPAGLVPGSGFRSRPPASAEPGRATAPWWGSSTARRSCSPAMSRARNTTGGSRLKGKALRKRSWH